MLRIRGKLFCEISPTCYAISLQKEIIKRHIKNITHAGRLARSKSEKHLPNLIAEHSSNMIKRAPGINLEHQENKAVNIAIAGSRISGIIIHPGEEFSFWHLVGKTTKRKGYKEGRIIRNNKLVTGTGGGLCNLANTIHLLVLDSPLTVTEFHKHSDALAPDQGRRVPLSAGTSVSYNNLDFRFRNDTQQDYQLLVWCAGEELHAQLRSETAISHRYSLIEEDHHFRKEGDKYYRISKIYRQTWDKVTGEPLEKKLILDNHSEVMFDPSLIPQDQIRQ